MGLEGRLVAKYAGSSKLLKRISLIISGMNFGDMLDIAKWLRMRRKCPGRDLLLTTVCRPALNRGKRCRCGVLPDRKAALGHREDGAAEKRTTVNFQNFPFSSTVPEAL